MKDGPKDFATPEKQEARTFLRERFLRLLSGITDKECQIHFYDKTTVAAKFGGTDVDVWKIFVTDLDGPTFKVPQALLRTTDVLSVEVPNATFQKLIDPPKEQNGSESMECDGV